MRARPALDATPGAPLNAIPGSVPLPGTVKSGCRFTARCARAQDICRQEMPPLEDLGDGHHVRCWYPH
ncbi:ABC transporter ATP-binding protein [Herbaspirillum sp. BH-1]|nr:ABC transporter ATP-binding protein [Herbaspirillum sp. BH-1]